MRTTLTLEDDLARSLKEFAHRRDESFKSVVNRAIRVGLDKLSRPEVPTQFHLEPASLGEVSAGIDLGKALELSDRLEDEALIRKLELRK